MTGFWLYSYNFCFENTGTSNRHCHFWLCKLFDKHVLLNDIITCIFISMIKVLPSSFHHSQALWSCPSVVWRIGRIARERRVKGTLMRLSGQHLAIWCVLLWWKLPRSIWALTRKARGEEELPVGWGVIGTLVWSCLSSIWIQCTYSTCPQIYQKWK